MGATACQGRRSFAPPSVLPDISPTRGEIGRLRVSPIVDVANWRGSKLPISPLVGEMSGRTEGGNVERTASPRSECSRCAMTTFTPTTSAEVLSAVQWALSENAPLEILGARHQARHRPAAAGRAHARPVAADGRHALRAGGAGADGEGRHAARRDRENAGRAQPGTRLRADGLRPAARAGEPGKRARSAACWPPICPARAG